MGVAKFLVKKKFNGKTYEWEAERNTKTSAQRLAKELRGKGKLVRIAKHKRGYGVYVRNK